MLRTSDRLQKALRLLENDVSFDITYPLSCEGVCDRWYSNG